MKPNLKHALFISSALIVGLLVGCSGEKKDDVAESKKESAAQPVSNPNAKLTFDDVKTGTGEPAEAGDLLLVQYVGKLKKNGEVFDSNLDPSKAPFPVRVGAGNVIKGWDEGLVGMKKGGMRKLHIPSALAYGEAGSPPKIGPNEDLEFEVTVLDRVGKNEEGVYDKADIKVGTGKEAITGTTCDVHYTGKLVNGKQFDSSKQHGDKPLTFTVGAGQVIKAWDVGIVGMREGGIRTLRVPPAIAYGKQGSGENIPGEQVLLFTIELLKVKPAETPPAPGQPGKR